MSITKKITRKQSTVVVDYWHVYLVSKTGIHGQHPGWIVAVERPQNLTATDCTVKQAIELLKKSISIDDGPDGEWEGYELQAAYLEWLYGDGHIAELY